MRIDLNCDVGEGINNEHLLMPYISSCNIACGGHFGDVYSIDKTIKLAIKNKVKVGAHPSFPDKENFGRKLMKIDDEDLKRSLYNQLHLFQERISIYNINLHHIKPHGALYNVIAVDEKLAILFLNSVKEFLKKSYLYVPFNSVIEKIALKNKIKIKYEAFADRNYNDDLTLVSRKNDNALIIEKKEVLKHVLKIARTGLVTTLNKNKISIKADTFCVHGDTENAIEIVKYLDVELKKEGFRVE